MHHDRKGFEGFLWGQVLLFGLLGATLALFLAYPSLRAPYALPELKLVLATVFMLAGGLVAVLTANRFAVEGRRYDLLLCCGFIVTSLTWLCFTIAPDVAHALGHKTELWATIAGQLVGWGLIAAAPFANGRLQHRRAALGSGVFWSLVALWLIWLISRSLDITLPSLNPARDPTMPATLTGALAASGLLHLLAVVGFSNRFYQRGEDLDYWLAFGATLMLFSSLHFMFTPLIYAGDVSQGDYLRLLAYGVLLVGVWRAIRHSEFGRAVAEERARVAREIHDGLAQYLFAVSTHASMLEGGADPEVTLPRLKEAALAAQQEARYAILALSSAAGRSPFDAALRRYVDFLTADGALEVELEIDASISLGPDEQIELFRIVQEGLANARKHAGAKHAWVEIGQRASERFVTVRDDGSGFDFDDGGAGQGLRNMRERATSIGGALTLRSTPGAGTALEVVLRT
ncbi:MAG TPA: ATP-binding protein [Gaiellaceae bacterium]|jgi:signal transduction histidine kinase|nr:ATP-binding protein [Gaiellaceae bacterium]